MVKNITIDDLGIYFCSCICKIRKERETQGATYTRVTFEGKVNPFCNITETNKFYDNYVVFQNIADEHIDDLNGIRTIKKG